MLLVSTVSLRQAGSTDVSEQVTSDKLQIYSISQYPTGYYGGASSSK